MISQFRSIFESLWKMLIVIGDGRLGVTYTVGETKVRKLKAQGNMRRQNRGTCINKMGKERLNFVKREELAKYKYLCCEAMTRQQWKKSDSMPYRYCDWKMEIKQKYDGYNEAQLEEFNRYLEMCIRKKRTLREINSIIYAAIASSSITLIWDRIVGESGLSLNIVQNIIMWVFMIASSFGIVHVVFSPINNESIEKNMYVDYQRVVEEMLIDFQKAKNH